MTILIQYSPAWVNPNLSSGAAWALLLTRGQRYGRGRWCLPPWAAAYLGAGCTSLPALGRNHDRRYDSHLILVASGQPHQPGWGRWRRQNVLTCPSHRTPPPPKKVLGLLLHRWPRGPGMASECPRPWGLHLRHCFVRFAYKWWSPRNPFNNHLN